MSTNNRKPARWSDFDKYLKAEHLKGQAFTLTIARVEVEITHPRPGVEATSPVIYFRETDKGLIVSPTNQDALTALFGDDIAAAIGQRVTLRALALRVAGRDVLPIRLYPAAPEGKTAIPTSPGLAPATGQTAAEQHQADKQALFGPPEDVRLC